MSPFWRLEFFDVAPSFFGGGGKGREFLSLTLTNFNVSSAPMTRGTSDLGVK